MRMAVGPRQVRSKPGIETEPGQLLQCQSRSHRITGETSGETDAQVVLAGGQGRLPERASPYSVKLQWRLEDRWWRLARFDWE